MIDNGYNKKYLDLLIDILETGVDRPDRTGVGSRATFGKAFTVDLSHGFPILNTRKVGFRIAFEETMFFLRGDTNTKLLEEKNINIWKGNTSREFLDKMGLAQLPEGDMGKGYGYQWASWDKYVLHWDEFVKIDSVDNEQATYSNIKVTVSHINQAKEMLERAKKNPNDRRLLISAWNVAQLDQTPLVPCHVMHQYQILGGKLNSLWFQRSVDTVYGLPYNVMSYAFLNVVFAKYLNLIPGTLTFFGGDTHIYSNQIDISKEQVLRDATKYSLPTLNINKELNSFQDILDLEYSNVELIGYESYPDFKDKPPMAV